MEATGARVEATALPAALHAGALSAIFDRINATVSAHRRCAPSVDGREDTVPSPAGERDPPAPVDVELVGDERFRTDAGPMDVSLTPGHTGGHLSVHFPEASLVLAGDALTADEDGLAGPGTAFTHDVERAFESAERLAGLDIEQVLWHHGGLVGRIATESKPSSRPPVTPVSVVARRRGRRQSSRRCCPAR